MADLTKADLAELRRPFTPAAVKWKVQTGKLVVPYIDARLAIERLNAVIPDWHDEYEPVGGGQGLLCRLTVGGVTRIDVGSGYQGKGLYSDAFKRAAVKFGVGVSIYALPKLFLDTDKGHLAPAGNDKNGKPKFKITDKGLKKLAEGYEAWLDTDAGKQFGEPLDHGDVAGAIGDIEADTPGEAEAAPAEQAKPLTDTKATALIDGATNLFNELGPKKSGFGTNAGFRRALAEASTTHNSLEALIEALEQAKRDA